MKVIFLDMDGVLNSHAFMTSRAKTKEWDAVPGGGPFKRTEPSHWTPMIDPAAVRRFNTLLKETAAKIVISSSWRHAHPHKTGRMQKILDLAGMVGGEVIDETPIMVGPRSFEIASWLASHSGAKKFAILDDGSDAGKGMDKWFVNTELAVGLTDADVRKAINILGRK
jgi:hypothetical protein